MGKVKRTCARCQREGIEASFRTTWKSEGWELIWVCLAQAACRRRQTKLHRSVRVDGGFVCACGLDEFFSGRETFLKHKREALAK